MRSLIFTVLLLALAVECSAKVLGHSSNMERLLVSKRSWRTAARPYKAPAPVEARATPTVQAARVGGFLMATDKTNGLGAGGLAVGNPVSNGEGVGAHAGEA